MEFHVRRLEATEARLLRELRIAALRDAPDQFAETVAQALARSDEEWVRFAAFAFDDASDGAVGRVGGMWVAPAARRTGIGSALVEAALSWARAAGKRRVRLWAVPTTSGERLYRRARFVPTGNQKPFPGDDSRVVIEMEIELSDAG
jgi:GNAT superfamily N-acetyltransferase